MRKRFTGYERDAETDLDFAQARYHSSKLGRFSSPDPYGGSGYITVPQSLNRYVYCLNRPLVFVDPSGLIWLSNDGGNNHIWVNDDFYNKNKDKYEGYVQSIGSVIKLGDTYGFGSKYDRLKGSFVSLNSNGTISAAAEPANVEVRGEYSDEEIRHPASRDVGPFGMLGQVRTPREGPPNSSNKFYIKVEDIP